jgi:bifunctional enzyme CysN/CysC/sulfate adenylyltransferase subunit 1
MLSLAHEREPRSFAEYLQQDLNTELLRFTTAGSVDDGKSTLIGRLLHDSKAVYEDQLASVKKSRVNRSSGPIDFSLLTDGLRAEREQGITIDVAYRYFSTARRKFIIADTPGHEQYTRNMATGASTADLAVILLDATKGILAQTRRHAFIASLLRIRNVLAAVNKMDLVAYREDVFARLEQDFLQLACELGVANVQCIPISALAGDNVVDRSSKTEWYGGPTLLEHLETVPLPPVDANASLRFPVQTVIRPDAGFRGFAGRVASGVVRPGDEVVALPSGQKTRVDAIVTYDSDLREAFAPMSVTLRLSDEIDLSRGDMLVAADGVPHVARKFSAMLVWLHAEPLEVDKTYVVKHTARQTKIRATSIRHRVDVNTLAHENATQLQMNEIALVEFEANVALFFDAYANNRATGSFIVIDPLSNATVGAGMIEATVDVKTEHVVDEIAGGLSSAGVAPQERSERNGHFPGVIFVGNRPEIGARAERALFDRGFATVHVNGEAIAPEAIRDVLRVAQEAGCVVIFSGAVESRLVHAVGRVFDATALAASESGLNEGLVRAVLAFAQTLRLKAAAKDSRKVH